MQETAGSKPPVTVSLAMIAANHDAATLATAIQSAKPYVDEVVVAIDPLSEAALEVAVAEGAVVIPFDWCDDFAKARNAALDACTSDWILVLDADEQMANVDRERLFFMMENAPAIYTVTVVSDQGNGHTVLNDTTRLFPREGVRYFGELHETPRDTDRERALQVVHLDAFRVLHSGYTSEAIDRGNKLDRNLSILGGMIVREPINPLLRMYVAQALYTAHPEAASDQLRLCLHYCRLFPMDDSKACYDQAASDLMSVMGAQETFAQAALEADLILKWREPAHPGFWVNLANAQINIGAFPAAVASAYKAKAYATAKVTQTDTNAITWLPDAMAGVALANMGDVHTAAALAHVEAALRFDCGGHTEKLKFVRGQLLER